MHPIDVVITSDFICPWCWIGHRNLVDGIELAGLSAAAVHVRMAPFELNPDMPREGLDRQTHHTAELGRWARSMALDAQVAEPRRQAGAPFHDERVFVTPNTRLAHRLMFWAQTQDAAQRLRGLPEALFRAYFAHGQDIGKVDVLAAIAADHGYDGATVRAVLQSNLGGREVAAEERQAQVDGVDSVPMIRVGKRVIRGAQPAGAWVNLLRAAGRINQPNAEAASGRLEAWT